MYHLMMAYREWGDYQKAVFNWERAYAMKKNPKEEFLTAAALSYGSLKEYDKALAILRIAMEKYPSSKIFTITWGFISWSSILQTHPSYTLRKLCSLIHRFITHGLTWEMHGQRSKIIPKPSRPSTKL